MKIFIKQSGTGLYFREVGVWVKERTNAREFHDSETALEACNREGLTQVEIVLNQTGTGYDLRLPVGPNDHSGPPAQRRFS